MQQKTFFIGYQENPEQRLEEELSKLRKEHGSIDVRNIKIDYNNVLKSSLGYIEYVV